MKKKTPYRFQYTTSSNIYSCDLCGARIHVEHNHAPPDFCLRCGGAKSKYPSISEKQLALLKTRQETRACIPPLEGPDHDCDATALECIACTMNDIARLLRLGLFAVTKTRGLHVSAAGEAALKREETLDA